MGNNVASKDLVGKVLQEVVLNNSFWDKAHMVCKLHAPISKVLKMVDGEKQATMGYVFEGMRRSKLAIEAACPRAHKKYCNIIDDRWKRQMIQDIHITGN